MPRGHPLTTEPTGPANNDEDPLGPSAPQPEPTGDPRRPGSSADSADNIRDAQGTSPGGTVPAGHSGGTKNAGGAKDAGRSNDAGSAKDAGSPEDSRAHGSRGSAPEDALNEPESADG